MSEQGLDSHHRESGPPAPLPTPTDRPLDLPSSDRIALARSISALEEGSPEDLIRALSLEVGGAWVLGVTGPAGVGKSTLISRLIEVACREGRRVAVIAVDPSSLGGGALLGDRVRMLAALDDHRDVFMRSLASRSQLGGLSRVCPAAMRVLAAGGYETIILETVGVGQAEVEVMEVADTVLVLAGPDGGDWLQAAKSGLMEIGHVFGVTKADREGADTMVREIESALHLKAAQEWNPPVVPVSVARDEGIEELWAALVSHREQAVPSGALRRVPVRAMAQVAVDAALATLADGEQHDLPEVPADLLEALAASLRQEG